MASVVFKHVSAAVAPPRKGLLSRCWKKTKEDGKIATPTPILRDISGHVLPGQFTAVIGESGSGKTTLLDILAGVYAPNLQVTGLVTTSHTDPSHVLKSKPSYVMQDDVMLTALTPREIVHFSAMLNRPSSEEAKHQSAHDITNLALRELGLEHCADVRVGGSGASGSETRVSMGGLSGGERRRVSIAINLVTDPCLLFLDEPTSGLDFSSALSNINQLRELAHTMNKTVVATIHSPASRMMHLIDHVILLSSGRVLFNGPSSHLVPHFSDIGLHCPTHANPFEFVLAETAWHSNRAQRRIKSSTSVLRKLQTNATTQDLAMIIPRQHGYVQTEVNLAVASTISAHNAAVPLTCSRFMNEVTQLTIRNGKNVIRHRSRLMLQVGQSIALSIFVGLLYINATEDQNGIIARVGFLFFMMTIQAFLSIVNAVLMFTDERALFIREQHAHTYHVSSYFIARTLVDLPLQLFIAFAFSIPGYFMVGLQNEWLQFFTFVFLQMGVATTMDSCGLLLGSLFKHPIVALMACPVLMTLFMVCSGFFVHVDDLPPLLGVLKAISPQRYAFTGLMQNEFKYLLLNCEPDQLYSAPELDADATFCPFVYGEEVLSAFGLSETDHITDSEGILLTLLAVSFRFIAYLALRSSKRH